MLAEPGCIEVLCSYCSGAEPGFWPGVSTGATSLSPLRGYPERAWVHLGWVLLGAPGIRAAWPGCVQASVRGAPQTSVLSSITAPHSVRVETCR